MVLHSYPVEENLGLNPPSPISHFVLVLRFSWKIGHAVDTRYFNLNSNWIHACLVDFESLCLMTQFFLITFYHHIIINNYVIIIIMMFSDHNEIKKLW